MTGIIDKLNFYISNSLFFVTQMFTFSLFNGNKVDKINIEFILDVNCV